MAAGAVAASTLCAPLFASEAEPILNFDGIESIIQTDLHPEDLGIQGNNPKTFEAWAYTRAFTEGGVFHVGTSNAGEEFALRTHGLNDRWMAQFWGSPDQVFSVIGSSNNWTHFAFVYDGTTLRVYANGEVVVDEEVVLDTQGDEWPLRIGAWREQHFNGAIRDVRVWNVARTQAQIQANMSDTSSLPQANLVAWWPLDEGEGRVANDASGNGRHADIFAAQWEGHQLAYDPEIEADFVLDFGVGAGQANESGLLRNRADHFSLEDDSLRMTNTTGNFISSGAVASVSNYQSGQSFVLESEITLTAFPDVRASRPGLIVLGGPHVPLEQPFNTGADQNFYSVSFFPALPPGTVTSLFPAIAPAGDSTAVIAISNGFNGPFLAAQRWDGRRPGPEALFADDFETPANDSQWQRGGPQDSWEIGSLGYPSETVLPPVEGSTRVAATNLNSRVSENSEDWLRSPVIDLTGVAAAEVSYREALWIDDHVEDGVQVHTATVSVVDADGNFIAQLAQDWGNSDGWRNRSLSLPPEALGQPVRVEFLMVTDNFAMNDHYGWIIDDFEVSAFSMEPGAFAMRAEGAYGFGGELTLTMTLTDLADAAEYSQSVSTHILNPREGNLFGLGGRLQTTPSGDPQIDFANLSMTLVESPELVPTTPASAFYYPFGSAGTRVSPGNFALYAAEDWSLQSNSLQLTASPAAENSLAVTRVREFRPGNAIHVESDIVLSSLNAGAAGNIGLVLFGQEDSAAFDPNDSGTYYTFQYMADANGGSRIALREGTSGPILYESPFAAPVEGATYRFEFTGTPNGDGVIDFTAILSAGNGANGTLSGEIHASMEGRNRFGFGSSQGGGDVWDVVNFGGYTTVEQDAEFQLYRWTPLQVRGASSIQMSEFTFFYQGTDILEARRAAEQPMPTVTGSHPIGHEGPPQLVDGDTGTKWFGNDTSQPVLFTFDEPVQIDAYMMWTANDAPDRDPLSWRLEGSNDGFDWVLLDTVMNFPTPTDRFTRFMESGEFDLPTGALLNEFNIGGLQGATFRVVRNGEPFTLAWDTTFATSVSIQPDIGQVSAAGTVEVTAPEDDETVYTLTAVGADGAPQVASVTVRSVAASAHTYQYVRFDLPDATSRRGAGNSIQLAQFQFYLEGEEVVPVGVSNPGGNTPANEPVSNLLVPSGKWLDFNGATRMPGAIQGSRVVFDFGETVSIDGYRFVTANDAPERDPVRWRLWGRNVETEDWTLIEHMAEAYPVPTARNTPTQTFPLVSDPVPTTGVIDRFSVDRIGGEEVNSTLFAIVYDGTTVGLTWETIGTTNASINPTPGAVDPSGTSDVLPPQSASTNITISAPRDGGTDTATAWVRSVPEDHFESVRYVRFDIPGNAALRNPNENSIQLSRFFFYRNGTRVDAISVSNPGGDTPSAEPAGNLLGDSDSKWLDFNRANVNDSHLVFDFGQVVEIDSYQFGTANDSNGRDPLRWRLYGRVSEEDEWELIENMPVNYPVPTARLTLTNIIPLPGAALAVPSGASFADWRETFFEGGDQTDDTVSGPLATPAGDGVANLLKYAFGLDPWTPVSAADMPQPEVDGATLRLTYLERVGATDILYTPQRSYTLGNDWDTQGIQEVPPRVPVMEGEFEWVTVELPLNGESKAFLRVQVRALD